MHKSLLAKAFDEKMLCWNCAVDWIHADLSNYQVSIAIIP